MPLFLIVFFSAYGAMHLYLFFKLLAAYPHWGFWGFVPIGAFLLSMVLSPLAVHYLDRSVRHFRLARVVAHIGYVWMAMIFWFLVLAAATDLWNLGVRTSSLFLPATWHGYLPAAKALPGIGVVILALLGYGLCEARSIRLRRLSMHLPNWPAGKPAITLVQVSDLHLGVHVGRARLAKVFSLVRDARPDVLVSTGDLVDSHLENIAALARRFEEIHPPLGKFAVLGNHEFYNGLEGSLRFHELAGFRVLRGEAHTLNDALSLRGVDDPAGRVMDDPDFVDENPVLPAFGEPRPPTILLKHQPTVLQASVGRFDLQLSGHAHGGQLFPFHALTASVYHYFRGWHDLGNDSALYVNLGAGTWGPPVRLGARPEVVVLTIGPAEE